MAEIQAQQKIKELEAELEVAKRRKPTSQAKPDGLASKASSYPFYLTSRCDFNTYTFRVAEGTTPVRPLKGASLANPNKKARKYQALEFASDED